MFASHALMIAFTVAFAVTGLYSLVRFAGLVSGASTDGDRVAELTHLLMSLAMIAMTWAYSGGPDTASGILQIVVFGLLGLWFLGRIAGPDHGHGRSATAYHLVMSAAMVWMVAAMPVLMSGSGMRMDMSAGGGAHADHASMAGMDDMPGMHGANGPGGMDMSGMGGAPTWARVITYAFVVLLVAAMAMWSSRLFRPVVAQVSVSEVRSSVPASGTATAVLTRTASSGVAQLTGPRLDAACHLLMSLGMAAALLAMR
ncbi:DUF5134 domain-containing protein [Pseudonocardia sp. CA-142604]|uniref:DUF5134 domain-containing protein n=1 Tax=Pseudonocardia sp. CA-142604 TaxID=3240024 RepID=UPI003D92BAAC